MSMMRTPHPKKNHYPIAPFISLSVQKFFALVSEKGIALTDLAEQSHVSYPCLVKWKRKHSPVLEKFERALGAMGYELVIREKSNSASREI